MDPSQVKIAELLDLSRRRVRRLLWAEAAARLCLAAAAFYWGWMGVDWFFEPTPDVRRAVFAAAALAAACWVGWSAVLPAITPLSDARIAGWLERQRPRFAGSLLTAVTRPGAPDPATQALAAAAAQRAAGVAAGVDGAPLGSGRRLGRLAGLAAAGLIAALAWGAAFPTPFYRYAQRLALSPEGWPRSVRLTAVGFELDGSGRLRHVAPRDEDYVLTVLAEPLRGAQAPTEAFAAVSTPGLPRRTESLVAVGDAQGAREFRLTAPRLLEDTVVYVRARDGRLGPLYIDVSPRPVVTGLEITVRPPAYLGDAPWRAPAAALRAIPVGSIVEAHGQASAALGSVEATLAGSEGGVALASSLTKNRSRFTAVAPPLTEGALLAFELVDSQGIRSAEPYRVALDVTPDAPPRPTLALRGVGAAVTPAARVGLTATVEDDHAVVRAAVTVQRGAGRHTVELLDRDAPAGVVRRELELDLLALASQADGALAALEAGETLTLRLTAADACDLGPDPREVASQEVTLEVVTQDELLARLEEREVNLRRTFEATVSETRRLAREVEAGPADEQDAPRWAAAARKAAQETLAVAAAFDQVVAELDHNRVPDEDLKSRLREEIARPLVGVGETALPHAADLLEPPPGAGAPQGAPPSPATRLAEALDVMERALDRMRAIETYHEVVSQLRGIIDAQRGVQKRTSATRSAAARSLLLDE